ncbi:hypothetical protein [Microbispora sp. NBRC 16548]|uniref:hypothetical protein n=1 Tax=Microbispora sp. NBRC 16548 TaxID=3030994 RepID=UPI001615A524|nr:hypothetical protein [Microbispora sp. NBRC 16548]GLX03458.1 hypothetical protein Misp03_03850 [Microbispora sp. NBRC 16548]
MDALALAAASALVSVLATEGWQDGRRAVVALWRRARPEQAPAVEADLAEARTELLAAREAGDEQAEQDLVVEWRQRLRRLAAADPEAARELRRIVDEELTPLLPPAGRQIAVNQNATVSGFGRVNQAGRDIRIGRG